MKIKYFSASMGAWFCFKHAVSRAFLLGQDIEPIADDFDSEYDMRDTTCVDCARGSKCDS